MIAGRLQGALLLLLAGMLSVTAFLLLSGARWSIQPWLPKPLHVAYIEGGLLQGRMLGQLPLGQQRRWLDMRWRWCPGLNPLNWCLTWKGDGIEGALEAGLHITGAMVQQAQLQLSRTELQLAGLPPMTLDMNLQLSHARFPWGSGFPRQVSGELQLHQIEAVEQRWPEIRGSLGSVARSQTPRLVVNLESDALWGTLTLAPNGTYTTDLGIHPSVLAVATDGRLQTDESVPLVRSGSLTALLNR